MSKRLIFLILVFIILFVIWFQRQMEVTETPMFTTPLHQVTESGNIEAVLTLISKGVDVNTRDIVGRTPLHYAAFRGYIDIV